MSFFNRGSRPNDDEKTMPLYDIPQPVTPDVNYGGSPEYPGASSYNSFSGNDDDRTMPMTENIPDFDLTMPPTSEDDGKTIGIYDEIFVKSAQDDANVSNQPAVGWLVCTGGSCLGRDFRVYAGRNSLGRGENNSIRLEDNSVSRETQVFLVFDPRTNRFFAAPGSSTGLCYLNGGMVLSQVEVKKNDVLELGSCKLMLIPCCDEHFNWNQVLGK